MFFHLPCTSIFLCVDNIVGQVIEDLRERYFGPLFELKSHDKVCELRGYI